MFASILFFASVSGRSSEMPSPIANDLQSLSGEWVYMEDRTPGRTLEQMGPPMSAKFSFGIEDGAVILISGHGSGHANVRVALDGTITEVPGSGSTRVYRYSGGWEDEVFSYQTEFIRATDGVDNTIIRRSFQLTEEGLIVSVEFGQSKAVGLYRHPEDIPMPEPAPATIEDLAWISGNWVGSRGAEGAIKFEERWGPPLGGSMFASARTVNRGRLSAFEYLRIVERDGGLVYVAQPNGGAGTEFVLSEFSETRAVFDNPRHDYPKRIVYERSGDKLTATIGFMKGGSPRTFEFTREG